jgi:hypothetical protein
MRGANYSSWVLLPGLVTLVLACSGKAVIDGNGASVGGAAGAGHAGTTNVAARGGAGNVAAGGSSEIGAAAGGEAVAGAANAAGSGAGGAAALPPIDASPPTFDGITGVVVGSTDATLSWGPATDDTTPQAHIVYLVYQSLAPFSADPNAGVDPAYAASDPGATAVTLQNLESSTQYYWLVRAEDAAQNQDANTVQLGATTLVSFEGDIQPIFTMACAKSGCHSSNAPMKGLDLSDGNAYANIGLVPSRYDTSLSPYWGCQHLSRVQPGDSDQSFLMAKLNNVSLSAPSGCTCPTCPNVIDPSVPDIGWNFGEREPHDLCRSDPSCPGLPEAEIALISDWITQGALDN